MLPDRSFPVPSQEEVAVPLTVALQGAYRRAGGQPGLGEKHGIIELTYTQYNVMAVAIQSAGFPAARSHIEDKRRQTTSHS